MGKMVFNIITGQLIQIEQLKYFMDYRNKKLNRSLSPLTQHHDNSNLTISPDCYSKYAKQNGDTNADSHVVPHHTKQFMQSPLSTDYGAARRRKQQDYWGYTLAEINLQLDNNMNQIIYLLGKRKNLLSSKKKKVKEQAELKLNQARNISDLSQFNCANEQQFLQITRFSKNPKAAVQILNKIMQIIPNMDNNNDDQKAKSQIFWQKNKKLENQIDVLLEKLRGIDKNVQKQNKEIHQSCKELDKIEQHLKSFVGTKTQDHIQRIEPLFQTKKKKYDILNKKIKSLQNNKDKKIQSIKIIKTILDQLMKIRQQRLKEISLFFGIQNINQSFNFDQKQADFAHCFEELLRIKQKDGYLQLSQKQFVGQIQILQKQQDRLYSQLLRKQSDEAKAYHNYNGIVAQRAKLLSILSIFGAQSQTSNIFYSDPKQISKKFKDCNSYLKILLQEENSLQQGLIKTTQTSRTFLNLLKITENQKQRRYELLNLLESCIHKRGAYEVKKEQLRNLIFQESRNYQQITQYEQQLQAILTDGDIEGYKKIGNAIGRCQKQKSRLSQYKQQLQKQIDYMDRQVLSLGNKIKEEYEDILCDIIPSQIEYCLKNGEDVKKLRNHLKKMYKRLGILKNE